MAKQIRKLLNCNIYLNGNSLAGQADEIELPSITMKMAEHSPLGQLGTTEYPAGIEKLEAKIKLNGPYPALMKASANPFKAMQLQCRGSVAVYEGGDRAAQLPYVCYLTCVSKTTPLGNLKANENAEFEMELSVTYVKLEYGGELIHELDAENSIFFVDGQDLMAEWRANLGI